MKPFRPGRRMLLRGAGVGLSLPLLDAMLDTRGLPRGVAHAEGLPARLVLFCFPNGVVSSSWTPTSEGVGFGLSPSLMPLATHRDDINVLSGLRMPVVREDGQGPAGHAQGCGTFATGMPVPVGAAAPTGPSLDHVAAATLAGNTRIPVLALNNTPPIRDPDSAPNNNLTNHISWLPDGKPFTTEYDPNVIFSRLMGAAGGTTEPAGPSATELAVRHRKSILDYVRGEATRIGGRLGTADRARMDEYLTAVRELERDLMVPAPSQACSTGAPPAANMPANIRAEAMLRLVTLALRCDLTRVVSFALTRGFDYDPLPWLDISEQHHELAHDRPAAVPDTLTQIVRYETSQLAYLIAELKAVREGAGTLYDNTLIYFGSDMATGMHGWRDMPVVLAGRAGGRMRTGMHVRYPNGTSINRMFVSLLQLAGVPATKFGSDGTSPLAGLTT